MGHDCVKQADFRADFGGQMFRRSDTPIPHPNLLEWLQMKLVTDRYNL